MRKKRFGLNISTIVIVCITIMVSCILFVSIDQSEKKYDEAELERIETNIRKAIVTCYSIEGYYPSDIEYLVDNYGLIIDDSKINVFYQVLGSNLFPDILVTYKGK